MSVESQKFPAAREALTYEIDNGRAVMPKSLPIFNGIVL